MTVAALGWTVLAAVVAAVWLTVAALAYRDRRDRRAYDRWREDQRRRGERFCFACPDREACGTGWPCYVVRRVAGRP